METCKQSVYIGDSENQHLISLSVVINRE